MRQRFDRLLTAFATPLTEPTAPLTEPTAPLAQLLPALPRRPHGD